MSEQGFNPFKDSGPKGALKKSPKYGRRVSNDSTD